MTKAAGDPGLTAPLRLRRVGIDTYQEPVIYMREDCEVCLAEGFEAQSRVLVRHGGRHIVATLNVVTSNWLALDEAGLSEAAWRLLDAHEGEAVSITHPPPLESMRYVRAKLHGNNLTDGEMQAVIADIAVGRYADIELAAFVSACAGTRLTAAETSAMTRAMIGVGERLRWDRAPIVDKHCVGGLPGNRTTPIVVAIVAAYGLTIPKTSSRAITSPAGTADAMEMLAPVDLDTRAMRAVVEREGGCVVWGGSVRLSPADDILIRVERPLDIDSDGQLVASVLSKKVAAGATHVLIDMPVGATAKVRSAAAARRLRDRLIEIGRSVALDVRVQMTEGDQPIGYGIGPALEAWDVLAVLQNEAAAPADLRARALLLAGSVIELGAGLAPGRGLAAAQKLLDDGSAWKKFQGICAAQGGLRTPPRAAHRQPVLAQTYGSVIAVDNRRLARVAKLTGAPRAPAAGISVHVKLGQRVEPGQPLYTLHAQTPGELAYALSYIQVQPEIFTITESRQEPRA